MKKQTQTLLIFAGIGAAAYFLLRKKPAARMIESEAEAAESTETGKGSESMPIQTEVDAVIDTTKTGQTVKQAITQGKKLAEALKDANIVIKTPRGIPNISIKKGAKRIKKRKKAKTSFRRGTRLMKKAKRAELKAGREAAKKLKSFKFA